MNPSKDQPVREMDKLPTRKHHIYLRQDRNGKYYLAANVCRSGKKMQNALVQKGYVVIEFDPNDAHCLIHTVTYKP